MSESPLSASDLPDRRSARSMLWTSSVLLIAFVLGIAGIIVVFKQAHISRVLVPKFEIGGNVIVRVVRPDGKPLEGAMVTPSGLRSEQSPGSGFGWSEKQHGPLLTVVTDGHGVAEVSYPKWTALKAAMLTSGITVAVEHPDFVTQMNVECSIDSTIPPVTLSEGGRVRLRVFRSDQTEPVTDFVANISGEHYQKAGTLDGETRLSPVLSLGEHFCRVVHLDKERGTQFGELIRFNSTAGKTEELEVRLQPGLNVRGRLDAAVPRPVNNGFVIAVVADETTDGDYNKSLSWQDWVAVKSNGEFEFSGLPPASNVRLLAYCDGFVSRQPAPTDAPEHMRRSQAWCSLPQFFKISGPELLAEVVMEPAATARFKVVDARGQALAGVEVGLSPNVIYSTGSTLFGQSGRSSESLGKTFANLGEVLRSSKWWDHEAPPHPDVLRPKFGAKSDTSGEVFIQNIPARGQQQVYVSHDKLVVRGQTRPPFEARILMESQPGRTELLTITMEPKPEITPEMLLPPQPSLLDRIKEWVKMWLP